MKNTNYLFICALSTTLTLPVVAQAAIDDQGMAYVSASEGLSGRIQMRWEDSDKENVDGTVKLDTLRLYLSGDLDVGRGMKSTYYTEIRNNKAGDGLILHAYDIGLTGSFGSVHLGRLDGVTDRMVPGGSLDEVAGSAAESPTSYPDDNSLRYESPEIYGVKFGLSSKVDGSNEPSGSFDSYNVAVNYTHPIGVTAGFGFEKVKGMNQRFTLAFAEDGEIAENIPIADSSGYRAGLRYSQDSWIAGYEYRTFKAFNGFQDSSTYGEWLPDCVSLLGLSVTTVDPFCQRDLTKDQGIFLNFAGSKAKYKVHRFATQFKFDRFTASLNYSKESNSPDDYVVGDLGLEGTFAPLDHTPKRVTLGADLSYRLGSKSRIALGYKNQQTDQVFHRYELVGATLKEIPGLGFFPADGVPTEIFEYNTVEVDTFIIDYQVNF